MAKLSEKISEHLRAEIDRGMFPGAQYVVGEDCKIVAEDALGWAAVEPERIAVSLNTIYDLASLTKPLVTSLLSVMFAERGLLDLDAPLGSYLNEFSSRPAEEDKRRFALTRLLTHTTGLPPWKPLYLEAAAPSQIVDAIARLSLEPTSSPQAGPSVVYSDLNYILLGYVLERVAGDSLDRLARKEIFEPLKLERTMFNPPPQMMRETAATEGGQNFERGNACDEMATLDQAVRQQATAKEIIIGRAQDLYDTAARKEPSRFAWRTGVIWGKVHDGNSYFMGGVAGHAGLFSTAREAFRIANQFLPGSILLKPESQALFTKNFTDGCGSARSLGWILASTPNCSAGCSLPPRAFGHNGFTGTSLWLDPDKRRVFVLLTNRVHPKVEAMNMREARQRFHSIAVEALDLRKKI